MTKVRNVSGRPHGLPVSREILAPEAIGDVPDSFAQHSPLMGRVFEIVREPEPVVQSQPKQRSGRGRS